MSWSPRQIAALLLLTLCWGLNWPVMKAAVTAFPPLTFRSISMWLGLPLLWLATRWLKVPLTIERREWPEFAKLTLTNMLVWHLVAILAIQSLSSGRAAILGYTMPIFSAIWGAWLYKERLRPRQALGVLAAAAGITLLLWHELGRMSGQLWAAGGMLLAAAVWALGTQQMRRTTSTAATLALIFWMSVVSAIFMTVLSVALESERWIAIPDVVWFAIAYNAILIFGYSQPAWLMLARTLPPVASTMSVMMIPVIGTLSGAWWLNEKLHWQDGVAIVLMLVAIASVLWPARAKADQRA